MPASGDKRAELANETIEARGFELKGEAGGLRSAWGIAGLHVNLKGRMAHAINANETKRDSATSRARSERANGEFSHVSRVARKTLNSVGESPDGVRTSIGTDVSTETPVACANPKFDQVRTIVPHDCDLKSAKTVLHVAGLVSMERPARVHEVVGYVSS